jgi:SHS2 domain-containing protein
MRSLFDAGSVAAPTVPDRGFEFFEHTADLGIRSWGPTLGDAFSEAARGLFAHMTDLDRVAAVGEIEIRLVEENPDRLLHGWLEELLFVHQRDLLVFREFRAAVTPDGRSLVGKVLGEAYDAEKHGPIHEVKAVTYHGMRVELSPPRVEVIVDI